MVFPVNATDASLLVQPLLQQICWTENAWAADRTARNAKLPPEYQVHLCTCPGNCQTIMQGHHHKPAHAACKRSALHNSVT